MDEIKDAGDEPVCKQVMAKPKKAPTPAPKKTDEDPKQKVIRESLALQKKGEESFSRQAYDAAIDSYTQALQINGNNAAAWAGRGGAKLRSGDAKGAKDDLDKALMIEPRHLFALRDRGEARSKLGDLKGGLEDYNEKLTLAPADGRALCGRAEVRQQLGDKEGAINDLNLAVRLTYPGSAELLKAAKKS